MNQLERCYKIHQMLRIYKSVSREQLMDATGVSRATLMRDIGKMRDYMGAPIQWLPSPQEGYFYSPREERFELPGFWFSASELYALLASDRLLQSITPGSLLEPMRRHIQGILHRSGLDPIQVTRHFIIQARGRQLRDSLNFQRIAQAMIERRLLSLTYNARSSNQESQRLVDPQRLIHHRENWYLVAHCRKKLALRTFAVDAVITATPMEEPCQELEGAGLEEFLATGFGIFMGQVEQQATLRFSPQRSRWVKDELWHPEQQSHMEPDGSLLLHLPYGDPTELIMEILKHGAHVQVLAPPSLRHLVAEQLKEAMAHYQDKNEIDG